MKKIYLLLIAAFTTVSGVFAQSDCSSAIIVCGNTATYDPSGIGNKLEQLACGGIEHNSIWIAFQAKASGKLNFVIRPLPRPVYPLFPILTGACMHWQARPTPETVIIKPS
jgi:hypothetical protein